MASASRANENTPLLPQYHTSSPIETPKKAPRNVTFNPNAAIISPGGTTSTTSSVPRAAQVLQQVTPQPVLGHPPMLSALNQKLRRRNSAGSPFVPLPTIGAPKIGPQRTTKNAEKLKLLPNPDFGDDGPDEESGRDVYSQYTRIKDPTARRDAARLGKADRNRLPRVTAYCTASKYQFDGLIRFLKGRGKTKGATPKKFDECIYTPYNYGPHLDSRAVEVQSMPARLNERRHSDSAIEIANPGDAIIDIHTEGGDTSLSNGKFQENRMHGEPVEQRKEDENLDTDRNLDFDTQVHTPEVFLFEYGVVVIWGMSLQHEQRFLKEIAKFEQEKLAAGDVETESFNFYYTREYQARIYNDFITLREKTNYMTKLAISHALAQSVKTSLYEELVGNAIELCKEIPGEIAATGKISLTREQINKQIGELFILRISIHLSGSVLDTPEFFWGEPHLEPVYAAVRTYLEMDQRVSLLTERLAVIKDLLQVLKDQLSHGHGEMLEWIVIVLIAMEIVVAGVNIVVDVYAG